jgi:hypothetical protein
MVLGLEMWLKWHSTCTASVKTPVQILVIPKQNTTKYGAEGIASGTLMVSM